MSKISCHILLFARKSQHPLIKSQGAVLHKVTGKNVIPHHVKITKSSNKGSLWFDRQTRMNTFQVIKINTNIFKSVITHTKTEASNQDISNQTTLIKENTRLTLTSCMLQQQDPGMAAIIPVAYPYGSNSTGYWSTTGSFPGLPSPLLGTHSPSPSDPSARGSGSRSVTSIWQHTPARSTAGWLSHTSTAWLRPSAGPFPEQHRVPRTP